jgi:hypothetical protein
MTKQTEAESLSLANTRWRSWPLIDHKQWSWLLPAGILCAGILVSRLGGGWLLSIAAVLALAMVFWQFLLPVTFEITSLGLRRYALRHVRLVPWSAIHAYQLRSTGVVLFQRADPTSIDLLSSLFVPYPSDEDEVVVAMRLYLPHATEIP